MRKNLLKVISGRGENEMPSSDGREMFPLVDDNKAEEEGEVELNLL